MSDPKKGTESTQLGLPEVGNNATQVIDSPVQSQPTLEVATSPRLEQVTAPSLPPVVVDTVITPPRTKTAGGALRAAHGVVPKGDSNRRQSRIAQVTPQESITTGENPVLQTTPSFEWTMPRVAGIAGAVGLLFILTWVFWPSGAPKRPVAPTPVAVEPEVAVAVAPTPKPVAPVPTPALVAAPTKPTLKLDAKTHVIDPYAAHLEDFELDPAHKYRLRIERDDSHLGTALARLDEKEGWGVMRKMASHAMLQFGGAKHLRLHCEPGSRFQDGQTLPLELVDLATKKKTVLPVNPALHCWDFEVARVLDLGEGVKKRVRVPTDSKVVLGEKQSLRVAYVLESLGEKKEWRTGVLAAGESVLAEGRMARFAILDSYAGDNEGTLELELLPGDTENSGLVTPSATGAQFVVPK